MTSPTPDDRRAAGSGDEPERLSPSAPEESLPPVPPSRDVDALSPLESFLATLDLVDTGARTTKDIFTGPSQWMPHGRVFGGQVAAQSVVAAYRTLQHDRAIHSMHGYFLRPGDVTQPITFSVDRIHDGNSFSTRHVAAFQNGLEIWSMMASFQSDDGEVAYAEPMPAGIPDPEDVPSDVDVLNSIRPGADEWVVRRAFETRHVDGAVYAFPSEGRAPAQAVWFRAVDRLPDDPVVHRAAIAYATDYTILEPVLRGQGLSWITPGLRIASLDHGVWWHADARADEWLLFVQSSPAAGGGRGLTNGRIFARDGRLVASVAQEGMVRVKRTR